MTTTAADFVKARKALIAEHQALMQGIPVLSLRWIGASTATNVAPGAPGVALAARESWIEVVIGELNWTSLRVSMAMFSALLYEQVAKELGESPAARALTLIDRNGESENASSRLVSIGDKVATLVNQLVEDPFTPPFKNAQVSISQMISWVNGKNGQNQHWMYGLTVDDIRTLLTHVQQALRPAAAEYRHGITHRVGGRADHSMGGFVLNAWSGSGFDAISIGTAHKVVFQQIQQELSVSWTATAKALKTFVSLGALPDRVEAVLTL